MTAIDSPTLTPSDWTFQLSEGGETYPFVEDENDNITGLGHQDKTAFADAVNRYDTEANGEPIDWAWDADHIAHGWATLDADGERLHDCTPDTPGAIAITTMWSWR
jgi:hypothetical protein